MDAKHFDALARSLIASNTRRGALGAVLGVTLALSELVEAEADRHGNQRHRNEVEEEKKGEQGKRGKKGKKRKKNDPPPPPPPPPPIVCPGGGGDLPTRLAP